MPQSGKTCQSSEYQFENEIAYSGCNGGRHVSDDRHDWVQVQQHEDLSSIVSITASRKLLRTHAYRCDQVREESDDEKDQSVAKDHVGQPRAAHQT